MINQWLCFLFQASPGPVIGFAMDSMLEVKENAPPKWVRVGVWVVVTTAAAVYRIFFHYMPEPINAIYWVTHLLATVIGICFFYNGSLLQKLAVNIILILGLASGEAASGLLVLLLQIQRLSLDFTQPDTMFAILIANFTSNIVFFFIAFLWRRFKLQKRMPRGSWAFILMLLCLLIPIINFCVETYGTKDPLSPFNILTLAGSMIFNLVLICIQFNQAEKDEVEKELFVLKHQSELERQHYQNVESSREEMAKIRHDYNNLITSVLGLLHMNKTQEAEKTLKDLLVSVEATREFPYCGIPIVNAILSEKEAVCRKNGIALRTDLLFPEDTAIAPIDLCSIFANLLDNAIRACTHLPPERSREITLSVAVHGDYLLIRCDNPALKAPGKHAEGSGYGMKILNDIATRYGGEFQTDFADGSFTARLVLLCAGSKASTD